MSLQFLCCVQDDGHSSVEQQQTQRQDEQDDNHFFCLKLFTTPQTVHHLVILLLLLRYICATDAFDGGNCLLGVPPILQARKPLFNTSLPSFTFCLHFLHLQLLSCSTVSKVELLWSGTNFCHMTLLMSKKKHENSRLTLTFWCQWCDTYSEHLVEFPQVHLYSQQHSMEKEIFH